MKFKSNFKEFILYDYRYYIGMAFLICTGLFILFSQLGSLLPGIAEAEALQGASNSSLANILENPLNLPHAILQLIFIKLLGPTTLALRIPSVILMFFSSVMIFFLFKAWHSHRIAIIGTLLFASSSWVITHGRLGTDGISIVFAILSILMASNVLRHAKKKRWPLIILFIASALAVYTPLMIYILLAATIIYRKQLAFLLKHQKNYVLIIGISVSLLLLAPLFAAFFGNPEVYRWWLGVPVVIPTITEYFSNLLNSFGYIFWRSEFDPTYHLGNLAMLDIFTATMTALGLYHYEHHFKQYRTKLLMVGFIIIFLMASLSGSQLLLLGVAPFIYIFAATGIITLLNQWNEIFPKNPVARTVALLPLSLVLLTTMWYHGTRYFVAWPTAPETRVVYNSDSVLLQKFIDDHYSSDNLNTLIVAPKDEINKLSYNLLDSKIENLSTSTTVPVNAVSYDDIYIHRSIVLSKGEQKEFGSPTHFIVSERTTDSVSYTHYELTDEN